jgi:hypothetical protein
VGITFAGLFALVFGFLVKWLWNWLMPELFGIVEITYWQAFGLVILAKLLFTGFMPKHPDSRKGGDFFDHHWKPSRHPFARFNERAGTSQDKWNYYRKFWEDEGSDAFEKYVKKMERENKQKEK